MMLLPLPPHLFFLSSFFFFLLIFLPNCAFGNPLKDSEGIVLMGMGSVAEDRAAMARNDRERRKEQEEEEGKEAEMNRTRTTTEGPRTADNSSSSSSASSSSSSELSRALCQFFVFGTLFGIVCTISACTCMFRSRRDTNGNSGGPLGRGRRVGAARSSAEEPSISRLSRFREPFAPDKPYCLKFDDKGLCYASPLTREVPPLPSYEDACKMASPAALVASKEWKRAAGGGTSSTEEVRRTRRATTGERGGERLRV